MTFSDSPRLKPLLNNQATFAKSLKTHYKIVNLPIRVVLNPEMEAKPAYVRKLLKVIPDMTVAKWIELD